MKVSRQKHEVPLSSRSSHLNSFDPQKTIKFIRSSSKASLPNEAAFSSKNGELNKEIKGQGYIKMKSLKQAIDRKSRALDSEASL